MMEYVIVNSPWPEREGLRCRIVPKLRDEYPWVGAGRHEAVVKIDDDPIHAARPDLDVYRDWTCVLPYACLVPAASYFAAQGDDIGG